MTATALILTAGFALLVIAGVPFAFAIALCVSAATLVNGIEPMLLPQTIIAEQSIARLFIAGVLQGLLMALGMMALVAIRAMRTHPVREQTNGRGGAPRNRLSGQQAALPRRYLQT